MVGLLNMDRSSVLSDTATTAFVGSNYISFFNDKNRDLVICGKCDYQSKPILYRGHLRTDASEREVRTLHSEIQSLTAVDAYSSLSLRSGLVQRIKDSAKRLNATHLRFYNEGDRLLIVVFDYVKFHTSYRLPRKTSNLVRVHKTLVVANENFSTTFLASSFLKIPTQDLFLRIGKNGVTQISVDQSETKYLIRDQGLKEPMTVFESQQVGQSICFVFHPN